MGVMGSGAKGGGGGGTGNGDPLDGMPPIPALRSAKGGASSGRYHPPAAALALSGASTAGSLAADMMQLEQLVMRISRSVPSLANAAAPFIQQMRDLGAAAMADKAQGGVGANNPNVTAPPPGMGAPGPGPGGPMMPPPPVMAGMGGGMGGPR